MPTQNQDGRNIQSIIAYLDAARSLTQKALDKAIALDVSGAEADALHKVRGVDALLYYRNCANNAWVFFRQIERGEGEVFTADRDARIAREKAERNESGTRR